MNLSMRIRIQSLFLMLSVCSLLSEQVNAGLTYELKVLDTLGGSDSFGFRVNNSGQVVGTSAKPNLLLGSAFLSDPAGGSLHNIDTTGAFSSAGYGVNAQGQVTGAYTDAAFTDRIFITDADGLNFRSLAGATGQGHDLNDSGQVTGFTTDSFGIRHVFFYEASTDTLRIIDSSFNESQGNGINSLGQIAGSMSLESTGAIHAFLSDANGGALHDLGTLGGRSSQAFDLNDSGQVVGVADTANGRSRAFLSGPNGGTLIDLGTLGGASSIALGINALGIVVGNAELATGEEHGFIYINGIMTDLNSLIPNGSGFSILGASSISDTGYITGFGVTDQGEFRAYLLAPAASVPEPSSFVLLSGLGLGGGFSLIRNHMRQSRYRIG